jgi:RNA recognition motif-containing protein
MMGPRSSGFDEDREPRRDLPLPDKPPYTAFVGNLSFEVTEDEVKDFFPGKVSLLPSAHPRARVHCLALACSRARLSEHQGPPRRARRPPEGLRLRRV